jgi:hypothetical protein
MKKSRFSDSQILKVLKRADVGVKAAHVMLGKVCKTSSLKILSDRVLHFSLDFAWDLIDSLCVGAGCRDICAADIDSS